MKMMTNFLSIISLDDSKSGEAIYKKMKDEFFSKNEQLFKTCMRLATDQEFNMTGPEIGLGALLKSDAQHLQTSDDISHIFNLITKHSMEIYPDAICLCIQRI